MAHIPSGMSFLTRQAIFMAPHLVAAADLAAARTAAGVYMSFPPTRTAHGRKLSFTVFVLRLVSMANILRRGWYSTPTAIFMELHRRVERVHVHLSGMVGVA